MCRTIPCSRENVSKHITPPEREQASTTYDERLIHELIHNDTTSKGNEPCVSTLSIRTCTRHFHWSLNVLHTLKYCLHRGRVRVVLNRTRELRRSSHGGKIQFQSKFRIQNTSRICRSCHRLNRRKNICSRGNRLYLVHGWDRGRNFLNFVRADVRTSSNFLYLTNTRISIPFDKITRNLTTSIRGRRSKIYSNRFWRKRQKIYARGSERYFGFRKSSKRKKWKDRKE